MPDSLEERVGSILRKRGWTLALAESCTGGKVGDRITDIPGSSDYFVGSIVAYSYEAKERLLGVRHDTLYTHGAVSGETALEMARGARHALGTDVAVAVTGIAGPGGGLPGKPIGTTWVAVSGRGGDAVESHVWSGDREANKIKSTDAALEALLRFVEKAG
jgi:PncC family amidohydrolase